MQIFLNKFKADYTMMNSRVKKLKELKELNYKLKNKILSNEIMLANNLLINKLSDELMQEIEYEQIKLRQAKRKIRAYINLMDN